MHTREVQRTLFLDLQLSWTSSSWGASGMSWKKTGSPIAIFCLLQVSPKRPYAPMYALAASALDALLWLLSHALSPFLTLWNIFYPKPSPLEPPGLHMKNVEHFGHTEFLTVGPKAKTLFVMIPGAIHV
jgi:hypothetical protein